MVLRLIAHAFRCLGFGLRRSRHSPCQVFPTLTAVTPRRTIGFTQGERRLYDLGEGSRLREEQVSLDDSCRARPSCY